MPYKCSPSADWCISQESWEEEWEGLVVNTSHYFSRTFSSSAFVSVTCHMYIILLRGYKVITQSLDNFDNFEIGLKL